MRDGFGRLHDYLRISLTDNCNLRCFYCMPDEDYRVSPNSRLMQTEEVIQLADQFILQGIRKIRLTGGEPLIRKDIGQILRSLGERPVELSLTTNGVRLHEYLPDLIGAGVKTLNISLDTLQEDKFTLITRRPYFQQVMRNIKLMMSNGIRVKINVVLMADLNGDEINDFIRWTKDSSIDVRFIEFMPFEGNRWTSNRVLSLNQILEEVGREFSFEPLPAAIHDTAKHFQPLGHQGRFSIISTMSAPFCDGCNRIRLTADGKLKNCLFSDHETDLLSAYRAGEDIIPLIKKNIADKKKSLGGQFEVGLSSEDAENLKNRSMIQIGG